MTPPEDPKPGDAPPVPTFAHISRYPTVQDLEEALGPQRAAEPRAPSAESIQALVRADLEAREQLGQERYGDSLRAFNGRDALRDAYEEVLDLACYLKQALMERDTGSGNPLAPWERVELAQWRALAASPDVLSRELQRLTGDSRATRERLPPLEEAAAAALRSVRGVEAIFLGETTTTTIIYAVGREHETVNALGLREAEARLAASYENVEIHVRAHQGRDVDSLGLGKRLV